jgi:hypothetical protein
MREHPGAVGRILPRLVGAAVLLVALAPATAFAHGLSGEFFAVVTSAILVLHTAAIAGAILCLRSRRSWSVAGSAVLVAAVASIAWWLGFWQLAKTAATATEAGGWLLWIWLLAPLVLLVLSGAWLVLRHYSQRAV